MKQKLEKQIGSNKGVAVNYYKRRRSETHRVDGGRLGGEQFIEQSLRRREDLLGQLADQVLGELLQLVALQTRQRLADRRTQRHQCRL